MNEQNVKIFAEISIVNEYGKDIETSFQIDNTNFELVGTSKLLSPTGYQGYAYRNIETNEIIVVHEGSVNPLNNFFDNLSEINKDWIGADGATLQNKLLSQFNEAESFLNSIKTEHPDAKIVQVGQSLGGTISELLGALDENKNIETYTYNSLGAGKVVTELASQGKDLSADNSNIYNFAYNNEFVSKINPHIGAVYKSNSNEQGKGVENLHSVEIHYKNGGLHYELEENPTALIDIFSGMSIALDFKNGKVIAKLIDNGIEITNEMLNNYCNKLKENGLLDQNIIEAQISINNELYTIKTGDTMWDIANRFGVSQEELIEANPWMSDRYSEDKSFALIRPDEQIVIPEGSIKGTDNSGMDKYLNDALNGNIHPDTIAPDGVTLPQSGKTDNSVVEHYTTKPNMLSDNELLFVAFNNLDKNALLTLIPRMPKDEVNKVLNAWFFKTGYSKELAQNINKYINTSPFWNNPDLNSFWNGKPLDPNSPVIPGSGWYEKNVSAQIIKYNPIEVFKQYLPYWNPNSDIPVVVPKYIPPMAIDLDGEGIETIDINKSQIYFDVDNDGFREQTGWISKNEAILAIDKNGNEKIDNQSEMFGSTDSTGFEDLKAIDSNGDGIINSQDADFNKIRLWQDLNENGVTEEGELKTLTEAGIQSIYTNAYTVNGTDNNNIITEKATVQYADGTTKDLYDVATQYNDMYSVYGGDYILDADVIDLPWLRGYGNSVDLQLVASQNDNLKALVKQMASMTNANYIYNQFDSMMSMWLGENKTGEEMQKLVLSKLLRLDVDNMSEFQANNIGNAYNSLKDKLYVQFIAQTGLADKFDIAYDYSTDCIIYSDNTYENIVANTADGDAFTASYVIAKMLADDGSLDVTRLANTIKELGYGAQLINYLNSGLKFQNGEFKYVEGSKPLYVIGTEGDDTITGGDTADIIYGMDGNDLINGGGGADFLHGGRGNDTLYGGDGNDTLIGGEGDDTLEGGGGNDTYIYAGDGKDAVLDEKWAIVREQIWIQDNYYTDWYPTWVESDKKELVDAGDDVISFGKNVTPEDLTITKDGNNLVFGLKNTNNTLTIKNWYASDKQRVETFQFADGLILNANQILSMITGSTGNDTINGTDNADFIFTTGGNDTITMDKGNDVVVNQTGNTIYKFNEGDGQDVIYDYAGTDKMVLGYSKDRTLYRRVGGDLILKFKNSTDTLTIKDWFAVEGNRTETIEFSTGEIATIQDVLTRVTSSQVTNSADNIFGTDGNDTIHSYDGNDFISAGAGNDVIYGGLGNDIMVGGDGNDTYYVETPDDRVIENANEGIDSIWASYSYELPDNVENLYLHESGGSINGRGNDMDNKIVGNDYDNILDGKAGTNDLWGGKGDDTYIINASNANDTCHEGENEGNDTIKASITYTITRANIENLILTGTDDIDGRGNKLGNYIEGNSGSNVLRGVEGNDTLYGGGGVDSLYGGVDDDTYILDNDTTLIKEMANEGNDTVLSSISYTLTNNVENLTLTGNENLNAAGNTLDNVINGNSADNILEGKKGNDTISGGEGNDTYVFNRGDGEDTIIETGSTYSYIDKLSFGTGITIDDVRFNKSGNDLIVSIAGTNDKVIIKDSNINPDNRIEQFIFQDGTIVDGSKFYELSVDSSHNEAYVDFSFANTNSVSPYMDRTYYDHGSLSSNFYFDANRNLVEETYYGETGEISSTRVYTYNEDGTLSTMDDGENLHSYTYSSGLRTDTITSKSDNSYAGKILTYYNSNDLITKEDTYSEDDKLLYTSSYTYNSDNKLLNMLEKEVLYNSDGTSRQQNKFIKEYTYNDDGKVAYYFEYGWFKKANGSYTKYTAVQDNYTYNNYGQTESITHHIGYMNENEEYVKYKDEITYTYDSLNKLSTKITESGYRVNNVWQMHVSEKVTYEYDEETGLLSKETVDVGYQNNGSWTTKTSQVYTYEYNLQGMLTEKIRTDYTLQSNGSYSTVVAQKVVNTYDEETGRLILTNTYEGSNLTESLKYEYVYDDNGNLLSQKLYNGIISNNQANSYEFVKEVAMNYNNKLYGDYDNNVLYGGDFDDYLKGEGGSDTLYGGLGNDTLDGGANRDVMIGGKGNDTYYVGNATDKIIEYEDEGIDTVLSDITYQLRDNVENLTLIGDRADTRALGNNISNIIIANSVNNELKGFGGNDYLYGGAGNDTLYGGANDDTLVGGIGDDFLSGSTGSDIFVFSKGDGIDTVQEYAGSDDTIILGDDVSKDTIAIYKDNEDLIIDYGDNLGTDRITVLNQCGTDSNKYVERVQLNDGSYLSNSDINALIQNMTAYAANNDIQISSINDVKNNADLMNLVAVAWHS